MALSKESQSCKQDRQWKKISDGFYKPLEGFQYCLSKAINAEIRIHRRKDYLNCFRIIWKIDFNRFELAIYKILLVLECHRTASKSLHCFLLHQQSLLAKLKKKKIYFLCGWYNFKCLWRQVGKKFVLPRRDLTKMLVLNKLTLNAFKKKNIIFSIYSRKTDNTNLNIYAHICIQALTKNFTCCPIIQKTNSIKHLGLYLLYFIFSFFHKQRRRL